MTPLLIHRRNVLFYDKAMLYSVRIMQEKILNLGWSVLSHSPDLEPNDFHLVCSLQNALNDNTFSLDD